MNIYPKNTKSGFTIVELVVSIGIFAMMSALLLAKYGNFNQGVILTNLAYDVALTIRNAQSYGLNVKSATRVTNDFSKPFGVRLSCDTTTTTIQANGADNTYFIFYSDTNTNGIYDSGDGVISTTFYTRGARTGPIYTTDDPGVCDPASRYVDIVFKRPDPNAIIKVNGGATALSNIYITVKALDGSTRKILVNSNGQISVVPL
jgi:type II secretory pathway pseudopilin PulG